MYKYLIYTNLENRSVTYNTFMWNSTFETDSLPAPEHPFPLYPHPPLPGHLLPPHHPYTTPSLFKPCKWV